MPTDEPQPAPPGPSTWDVWTLWLAVGYAILLLLAALSVAMGWTGVQEALDVRRWFR